MVQKYNLTLPLLLLIKKYGVAVNYWVAYSGGLDSHVLLHALSELRQEYPIILKAIHVHHGVSQFADDWLTHCQSVCEHLKIPLVVEKLKCQKNRGDSFEALLRAARYNAFKKHIKGGDILLTAHHANDQAETILMRLCKGAGVKGLASMREKSSFSQGFLVRPFLKLPHILLKNYAKEKKLIFVEDDSNCNLNFTRNYLRHEVLPLLTKEKINLPKNLSKSAAHCREADHLLNEYAALLIKNVSGKEKNTLSVFKLLSLTIAQRKLVLRYWFHLNDIQNPSTKKLNAILHQVLTAKSDRFPMINWQDIVVRRFRDDLYLLPNKSQFECNAAFPWDFMSPLSISSIGTLKAKLIQGQGLRQNIQKVEVRFRKLGERAKISGRKTHLLKKLFQEWNVPPWERASVPLLWQDETLIAAWPYYVDPHYLARGEEWGWQLVFS